MRWLLMMTALYAGSAFAETNKGVWTPDQGDGTYFNPILNGDYSDPDVLRVGDDYYLTASSFTNMPGLPILHSRDLVNWEIIGHALTRLEPAGHYAAPRHGGGVWAPAIRFHAGKYLIYYPDPDYGIFVVSATSPAGPWSAPVQVDATKGAIDPAPFWDDNGQGYLAYAYAASRAGINNVIDLKRLSADGDKTEGEAVRIIDASHLPPVKTSQGVFPWQTTEGPKLYKRNGWYYVFAPSGGVKSGWQGVFRSRSITGPYEGRNVLDQGNTQINGPHQGAWVTTPSGVDWFIHFQDTDTYGRRVWLEPMVWGKSGAIEDWPIIGDRQKNEIFGQPVLSHKKPNAPTQPIATPVVSDSFAGGYHAGWQWSANPGEGWTDPAITSALRLKAVSSSVNLWEAPNLLTQKLPNLSFSATTRVDFKPKAVGERAGLVVLGYDYGWVGLENTAAGPRLVAVTRPQSNLNGPETVVTANESVAGPVWVRATLSPVASDDPGPNIIKAWPKLPSTLAQVQFSYSLDGNHFTPLGARWTATPGRWVGAQIGLFDQAASGTPAYTSTKSGYADFYDFKID